MEISVLEFPETGGEVSDFFRMSLASNVPSSNYSKRAPFLGWPLIRSDETAARAPAADTSLIGHLKGATYSIRMLRYWWVGQAIAEEAKRQGRALRVLDVGCERGWLKYFTPPGAVESWIGLDWDVRSECLEYAGYDEVIRANFDEPLPVASGTMDVVVSNHVMEHLPRPGSTMAEMSRVLRMGGIFLGGSPTMPSWLARLREGWLRRKLRLGRVAAGGHINCLSPRRWRVLMQDTGLQPEFVTGSHAVRFTGSWLENQRWWIRLNQLWGALFPSLGSECYVCGRRQPAWVGQTQLNKAHDAHWRPFWVGLGSVAAVLLALLAWNAWQFLDGREERQLQAWIAAHQEGGDQFIVSHDESGAALAHRVDVRVADGLSDALFLLKKSPHAHMLVTESDLETLCHWDAEQELVIDSRLPRFLQDDLMLIRSGGGGTSLREYWFTDACSVRSTPTDG